MVWLRGGRQVPVARVGAGDGEGIVGGQSRKWGGAPAQKPGVAWYFPQADTEEVRFTDTQVPNPWKWVGEFQARRHW